MATITESAIGSETAPRRSTRIFMSVRVVVSGKNLMGKKFSEVCRTVVINAHGGLVHMNQELADGAMLTITNPVTQEDLECRVVFLGELNDKGLRVGLEFLTPSPHFWGVEFTQKDWVEPKENLEQHEQAEERDTQRVHESN